MGDEEKILAVGYQQGVNKGLINIHFAPGQDITLVFTPDYKQFRYIEIALPHGELLPAHVDAFCQAMELAKRFIAGELEING